MADKGSSTTTSGGSAGSRGDQGTGTATSGTSTGGSSGPHGGGRGK